MSDLEGMADALSHEFMSDVADRFFGDRKRLDDAIELFYCRVEQLKEIASTVRARVGLLDFVLLRGRLAPDFWHELGVDHLPFAGYFVRPEVLPDQRPFALTDKGRWKKWLRLTYRLVHEAVDEYMHGLVYDHPRIKGKKMVTLHYVQLRNLHQRISAEVDRVNREMAPSELLSYTKGFSPELCRMEKVAGVLPEGYACTLDDDYKYMAVDFDALLLPEYPELPAPSAAQPAISRLADRAWKRHAGDIRDLLDEMSTIPDGCLLDGEQNVHKPCSEDQKNA